MIGVYIIQNLQTGKAYVGSSKNIANRLNAHSWMLRRGSHHCTYLQNAYEAYGADAFSMRAISQCQTRAEAQQLEQEILDIWFDDLYNISRRADHMHRLGRPLSIETKTKISKSNLGAARTESQREKISASLKIRYRNGLKHPQLGKPHSIEAKQKIKAKRATQPPTRLGMKNSEDAKKKQSLAKIGNRSHRKIVCTDDACFFGVDYAADHYGITTVTMRSRMKKHGWVFYEDK